MRYAAAPAKAPSKPAPAARAPHSRAVHAEPRDPTAGATNRKHDHRIALIASVSGGTLNRLHECVRLELVSPNGDRSCERLRSGSVDCSCEYCELFWSRLEERLLSR